MSSVTIDNAAKQPFMALVRELVWTYQAFSRLDFEGLRQYGLTQPQADVIFTLGNTAGLTFKEIGELTLITKGTLTGVIDRLEQKALVKRKQGSEDRRCTRVELTARGTRLFRDVFPKHIAYLKSHFDRLSEPELLTLQKALKKLRQVL